MAIWTDTRLDYEAQIRNLIQQHREVLDDPLLLAIYYQPEREREDVFLFEVLRDFDGGSLEGTGDFLEMLYSSSPSFPLHDPQAHLRLVVLGVEEFHRAANAPIPPKQFVEIKNAYRQGRAKIMFEGENALSLLKELE